MFVTTATVRRNGKSVGVACSTAPFLFLGTPTPKVTGGVANTLTLGNLRLFVMTDFKRGNIAVSNIELERCSGLIGAGLCRANYFPQEFTPKYLAVATTAAYTGNYYDQYYMDDSFVKLRELSATYTLPSSWVRGLNQASVTLAARELHTWTSYRGLDPEALLGGSDQAVTPPLQRIIATINLKW